MQNSIQREIAVKCLGKALLAYLCQCEILFEFVLLDPKTSSLPKELNIGAAHILSKSHFGKF